MKFFYNGEEENKRKFKANVVTAERRVKEKKQLIEDLQNEYTLLEEQAFNLYKRNVLYFGFQNDNETRYAITWLNMMKSGVDSEGKKLDKRKKYDEKMRYEWVTSSIREMMNDNSIVIDQIIRYGYDTEGYDYVFTHNNKKFYIYIPVVNSVPLKSYQYEGAYAFSISLHVYDSDGSSSIIDSTLFMDEVADIWKKYLEEEENKDV